MNSGWGGMNLTDSGGRVKAAQIPAWGAWQGSAGPVNGQTLRTEEPSTKSRIPRKRAATTQTPTDLTGATLRPAETERTPYWES